MAVAILGGVFDPPHNGHVALARAALEGLDLDRLLSDEERAMRRRPEERGAIRVRGSRRSSS